MCLTGQGDNMYDCILYRHIVKEMCQIKYYTVYKPILKEICYTKYEKNILLPTETK